MDAPCWEKHGLLRLADPRGCVASHTTRPWFFWEGFSRGTASLSRSHIVHRFALHRPMQVPDQRYVVFIWPRAARSRRGREGENARAAVVHARGRGNMRPSLEPAGLHHRSKNRTVSYTHTSPFILHIVARHEMFFFCVEDGWSSGYVETDSNRPLNCQEWPQDERWRIRVHRHVAAHTHNTDEIVVFIAHGRLVALWGTKLNGRGQ